MSNSKKYIEEKVINPINGFLMLAVLILLIGADTFGIYYSVSEENSIILISSIILCIATIFILPGFKIISPNTALVLTLFGKYYGTINKAGFFYVNPFATSALKTTFGAGKKISLKTMTSNSQKQKVNDLLGNPILVGAVVIWRVANPTKAVFSVENYSDYLHIQSESTIRNIARLYPYDHFEDEEEIGQCEQTLRGSSQEIADKMRDELQTRVEDAGIIIEDVRITDLSYAEEIAAAMLQRQQATAIIAARKKIVEGAVGMVNAALEQLDKDNVVVLDDERKAAMVSNLLVVLCGNKEAQPVVNSGTIY